MFNTITEVIEDLKQGKMVIVVDDASRENEGDLTIIAEKITPDIINFMLSHARGIICLTITEEHSKKIGLTHMVTNNTSNYQTPFTTIIFKNQVALISPRFEHVMLIIESQAYAQTQKNIFELIWDLLPNRSG